MNKNRALVFLSIVGMLLSGLVFAEHRLTEKQHAFLSALYDVQDRMHAEAFHKGFIKEISVKNLLSKFLDKSGNLDDELRSCVSLIDFAVDGHHKIIEFLLEQGVVDSSDGVEVIIEIITGAIPETIGMCQADGMDFSVAQHFLDEYIEIGKLFVKFGVFDPSARFTIESFQDEMYGVSVDLSEYPMEITLSQLVEALLITNEKAFARAAVEYQVMNNQEELAQLALILDRIQGYLKKFQQEVLV